MKRIYILGEIEREGEQDNRCNRIPIEAATLKALNELTKQLDVHIQR